MERKKVTVYTASEPLVTWVTPGQTMWDAIQQAGAIPPGDCGGRGTCGKCRIRVEGVVAAPSAREREHLGSGELERGYRLACGCEILGEAEAFLPDLRIASQKSGLLMFARYPGILPSLRILNSHIPPADRDKPESLVARIRWAFSGYELELSPATINLLASHDLGDGFNVTAALVNGSVIRVIPRHRQSFYGLAVDIGTTTLACVLIDLVTGEVVGIGDAPNLQVVRGRDVLSRISHAAQKPEGIKELQADLLACIGSMLEKVLQEAGVEGEDVVETTVVGNPVMLHLFLGLNPSTLGQSPYYGLFRESVQVRSVSLGLPLNPAGRVVILPQVGGFLGADVVGCLLAVDSGETGDFLLMDIGTNGEMVLKSGGGFLGCSVAAGPAFEGGDITSGMPAAFGAIDRFWKEKGRLGFSVLGRGRPRGICGSGLIDLLAVLLDMGAMDETGLLIPGKFPGKCVESERGVQLVIAGGEEDGLPVVFNQQDVRQLQLAKGALRAGTEILLSEAGIEAEGLNEILLAGAFGNHLNPASILRAGMLPEVEPGIIKNVGNAAARGAVAALVNVPLRSRASELAAGVQSIDLASREDFSSLFLTGMNFPSPQK